MPSRNGAPAGAESAGGAASDVVGQQGNDTQLAGALFYAEQGYPVFPLHSTDDAGRCSCGKPDCPNAGKHPRTARGFLDATTDLAQIRAWWNRWPGANIGMPTGPASGIYVADFDSKTDQGREVIAAVQRDADLLTNGTLVLTPGKPPAYDHGVHVWLWSESEVPTRSIGVGELKGKGGYVLVPPSRRAGRPYRFLSKRRYPVDNPLDWVTTLLDTFGVEIPEPAPGPKHGDGWAAGWFRTPLRPGTRRAPDGLPRIVGYLRGKSIDCETAIAIIELWDSRNPVPLGADVVREQVQGMYDRYGHPATANLPSATGGFEYRRGKVVAA